MTPAQEMTATWLTLLRSDDDAERALRKRFVRSVEPNCAVLARRLDCTYETARSLLRGGKISHAHARLLAAAFHENQARASGVRQALRRAAEIVGAVAT